MLVFKDQGVITGDRHVEISKWFGELEVTFYQHERSPHPQIFRVSNDPNEGCTGKNYNLMNLILFEFQYMWLKY